ncbi:MAG: hypothetical protein IJS14_15100 [Lentisphaeria bacterium]|nr:hypothetical protein [Lentisphaeria bacterium]
MSTGISLDGLWQFTFEDGSRTMLPVPGCFDASEAYRCRRGKGCYSRSVEGSGRMELACGGIGLRAEIFWDGRKIHTELTAYTPFRVRFDAGGPGEHELKIVCDNTIEETPESEFRRFYDFYGYGGIYREITLRRLPETCFDYVRVLPDPDRGMIGLHVELSGEPRPVKVSIDGEDSGLLPGSGDGEFAVPVPELWSPESPRLHRLSLDCGCDRYECRFGLRKIESRGGRIFLNGSPVKLFGVNRHDVFPDTGPAMTRERVRSDLLMIKLAGFNTIRGAHYPQSRIMLDLADELGLMVWDETLGWQNPLDSLTNPEFQRRQCDGLTRMIKSSVNHPSIIFWGFLNETSSDHPEARECIGKLCRIARELDPSRLVTFASCTCTKDRCLDLVDVISFNTYPCWYSGANTFFEPALVKERLDSLLAFVRNDPQLADKPVIISEIGAAALIGDHSRRRWSEDYQTELVECAVRHAAAAGAAGILLWQFCNTPVDDNVRIMTRPRGYNNKGLVDEFRNPKQAWRLFPSLIDDLKS